MRIKANWQQRNFNIFRYYRHVPFKYEQNFTPIPNRNLLFSFSFFLLVCSIPGSMMNPFPYAHPWHAAVTSNSLLLLFHSYSVHSSYTISTTPVALNIASRLMNPKIFIFSLDFSPELQIHKFIFRLIFIITLARIPQRYLKSTCPKLDLLSLLLPFKPSSLPIEKKVEE